jgi:hypothetical protein
MIGEPSLAYDRGRALVDVEHVAPELRALLAFDRLDGGRHGS